MVCGIQRRSRALAHLPGPKYPWLMGDLKFLSRKDPHRAATELAERYGPLVKVRVMMYHVRAHASMHGTTLHIYAALQPGECGTLLLEHSWRVLIVC